MNAITPEDFNLTPEEIKALVTGAQEFLPPEPDPRDAERLTAMPTTTEPAQP